MLKANTLVALTLTSFGAHSFMHLENNCGGQREIFLIKEVKLDSEDKPTIFVGQFIFELELNCKFALSLNPNYPNRICLPDDKRISSYEYPTPKEIEESKSRLKVLAGRYPKYAFFIQQILQDLMS